MNSFAEAQPSISSPRLARALARMCLATCLIAVPAIALANSDAKAPPQLAGTWKLNAKESDTMQKKMAEMRGGGPGGHWDGEHRGGMGGGMGGEFGGGGRHHGDGEGRERPEGPGGDVPPMGRDSTRGREMQDFFRPPLTLLIEQTDSTVVLSERGQTLQVLVLGELATAGAAVEPDAPHLAAKWRGQTLVAERASSRGGKLTRTFDLTKDGKRLVIVSRREAPGGRPPLELKRVYDHYDGD